ncbi:MAG: hypothetical protein AB1635_00850 [Acidobacteriota bacterium]
MLAATLWAAAAAATLLPPSPADEGLVVPEVNIRWTPGLSVAERTRVEQELRLVGATHREGTTWGYGTLDASQHGLARIVRHPAVADTHWIDRTAYTLAPGARSTRVFLAQATSPLRDRLTTAARPLAPWLLGVAYVTTLAAFRARSRIAVAVIAAVPALWLTFAAVEGPQAAVWNAFRFHHLLDRAAATLTIDRAFGPPPRVAGFWVDATAGCAHALSGRMSLDLDDVGGQLTLDGEPAPITTYRAEYGRVGFRQWGRSVVRIRADLEDGRVAFVALQGVGLSVAEVLFVEVRNRDGSLTRLAAPEALEQCGEVSSTDH